MTKASTRHKSPDKATFRQAEKLIQSNQAKSFYLSKKKSKLSHSFVIIEKVPYAIIDKIGKGGLHQIKLCQNEQGELAAFKVRLKKSKKVNKKRQQQTIDVLNALGRLKGHFVKKDTPYKLLAFIEGQDFNQYLKDNPSYTMQSHDWLLKLALSIEQLHELGIIHGDIKENNFIMHQGKLTVIDFDGSILVEKGLTRGKPVSWVTNKQSPPEIKKHICLDMKSDVYGLGVMMQNFIHNHKILMDESLLAKLANTQDQKRLTKLAKGMTRAKLKDRLSLDTAIQKLRKIKDKQKLRTYKTILGVNAGISALVLGLMGIAPLSLAIASLFHMIWGLSFGRYCLTKHLFEQNFKHRHVQEQVKQLKPETKARIQQGYCADSLPSQALTWLKPSTYTKDYYLGLGLHEAHPQLSSQSFSP